jgi:MraZ protein
VLRGRISARIDDKGRLKVPSAFRAHIEAEYGSSQLFLTSLSGAGESLCLYPLKVWQAIEDRVRRLPESKPKRKKFLRTAAYWGMPVEFDSQGRIVIPPALRESAAVGISTDVDVLGLVNYLEIWNSDRLKAQMTEAPLTDEDLDELSDLGI